MTAPVPANAKAIEAAAFALREGRLVAFPTETVYGVGADATSDAAVARLYAAKARPSFNPLIAHVAAVDDARKIAHFTDTADRLAQRFWPGPLTLVLPRTPECGVSLLASAGLDTVAVRVPAHDVARALIRAAGRPIVAPSANISGKLSPTTAADVANELSDKVAMILDAGPCRIGVESTVLDLSREKAALLRPGGIAAEEIAALIGPLEDAAEGDPIRSPGQLMSHYAPGLLVRLNAIDVGAEEALLAFGGSVPAGAAATLNLSPKGDLVEAAANLFAYLRRLDRPDFTRIAVMPIPNMGLGLAINDRLERAAAPR
ncbi:MAG: threonylcarbamoyl-AMP synthase [Proteobacteria bacterium]|nr:threonylcarbamoyl-AMP synthase [Pseudomonadota bacterium]MBI3499135.1 threonylcarbamoyl-AMP synthase [Pseudomonadota bacterium]